MSSVWWTLTRPRLVRSAIAASTTFTLSSTVSTFWIASGESSRCCTVLQHERRQGLVLLCNGHGVRLLMCDGRVDPGVERRSPTRESPKCADGGQFTSR